jgi:transcriptional regulator with XRE-family HTH domain
VAQSSPTCASARDAREGQAERTRIAANVRRLMARFNLNLSQLVQATELDERTIRSVLRAANRPHARTLHKLAVGLGIDPDELFRDCLAPTPASLALDRAANPAVAEVVEGTPELFTGWTEAEFDELYSRVAVGGQLTAEGTLAAADSMNRRRELMKQVAVILETNEADLLAEYVALLYRRATTFGDAPQEQSPPAENANGSLQQSPPRIPDPFTGLLPPQAGHRPGVYAGFNDPAPPPAGPFTGLPAELA